MEYSKGPQNVTDPNDLEGYAALREGAAIVDRSERRLLRLTGKDPIGMLNAVLTSDVPTHGDRGAYAMLLDPKGRIQTDLRVVKAGDEILIDTEPEGAGAAKGILARYAPFSRVRLEELSWSVLGLYGPRAREYFGDLEEHQSREIEIEGRVLLSVGVAFPVPGYDLIGPPEDLAAVRRCLTTSGATTVSADAHETARIESGVPRFGADQLLRRPVEGWHPGRGSHAPGGPRSRPHHSELNQVSGIEFPAPPLADFLGLRSIGGSS